MPGLDQLWSTKVWEPILARLLLFLPQLITGIVIFVVFWIVGVSVQRVVSRVCRVGRLDSDLAQLLGRGVKIALLIVGAMTALGTVGIDVTALVAGLGLTGFALGLALKDIISNAMSGILVLIYEPFKRNDHITVTGFEGTVAEINLRYTILDTEAKRTYIPNANLFTNPVVVHKRTPVKPAPVVHGASPGSPNDADSLAKPDEDRPIEE